MTDKPLEHKDAVTSPAKRNIWIAVLLALLVSPFFSFLYLGRVKRALVYLGLTILAVCVALLLTAVGYWPKGIDQSLLVFLIQIAGAIDSYRVVRRHSGKFVTPWYSRWYGLVGALMGLVFLMICVRAFLVEPFKIPSGAMIPTLLVGDFILVNKFTYGIRLPFVHTKVLAMNDPKRGDVMVFRYPMDPSLEHIKRVVGLPGDEVSYRYKKLTLNGVPVSVERGSDYQYKDGNLMFSAWQFTETLGEHVHSILIEPDESPVRLAAVREFPYRTNCEYSETSFTCQVPDDHYFVMGDNRDSSSDSRYWGFVPSDHIVGKAFMILGNEEMPERLGVAIR